MIFINMNIRQIIKESVDDFEWARELPRPPVIVQGRKFTSIRGTLLITSNYLESDDFSYKVDLDEYGIHYGSMPKDAFMKLYNNGKWKIMDDINESNDFEWAEEYTLPNKPFVGLRFRFKTPKSMSQTCYEVTEVDKKGFFRLGWFQENGERNSTNMTPFSVFYKYLDDDTIDYCH